MYCNYQDRQELEDDLYHVDEGDSEGSEENSELEFRLYSQLHYSANADEPEEQEDGEETEHGGQTQQLEVTSDVREVEAEFRPPSSNIAKSQKTKGEKRAKEKKQERAAKDQRSSLSVFEEVIVIDSSPEVISISEDDTADDDKGVCAVKGQSSYQLQTSTPAQQASQKRKASLGGPVTVDSSSSESDSDSELESKSESASSDSSDSDDLENWMILGRGKQDGDHSISLNVEGGSDSNTDAEEADGSWLVSDKDKDAQIYNKDKGGRISVQRVSNRYYTDKSVQCRNCNRTGHLSKNCPDPKKASPCFLCGTPGHLVSECPNRHCNNCGLPGHLYESCIERAYWHKQCHRCSMTGHFYDACPEIWRQYHVTTKTGPPVKQQGEDNGRTPAYCYNCSRKGHFGHTCTSQRMFKGTYATTPFITHYDTMKDIKCRQHRIKLRVKELMKNGLMPEGSTAPLTQGPPKKKQKTSHPKNNHHLNPTPHQTSKNHKPSHIFFRNDNDFRASTPKTNKYHQPGIASTEKQWKPKRPVPTSREHLPPPKLLLDEADDFPRGGGENTEKRQRRRRRPKKWKQVPPEESKKAEKRKRRNHRKADKKLSAQIYPTDENLFIIKQRKRSR